MFQVVASSGDPVSFTNSSATVSILDNQDRKFVLGINIGVLILDFDDTGVTIGFVNSSYFAEEGNTISVCVQLEGAIQRIIEISISTHNGSAISE